MHDIHVLSWPHPKSLLVSFSQFSPGLALIQLASLFYSWPITEPGLGASCKPDACLFMQRQSVFFVVSCLSGAHGASSIVGWRDQVGVRGV